MSLGSDAGALPACASHFPSRPSHRHANAPGVHHAAANVQTAAATKNYGGSSSRWSVIDHKIRHRLQNRVPAAAAGPCQNGSSTNTYSAGAKAALIPVAQHDTGGGDTAKGVQMPRPGKDASPKSKYVKRVSSLKQSALIKTSGMPKQRSKNVKHRQSVFFTHPRCKLAAKPVPQQARDKDAGRKFLMLDVAIGAQRLCTVAGNARIKNFLFDHRTPHTPNTSSRRHTPVRECLPQKFATRKAPLRTAADAAKPKSQRSNGTTSQKSFTRWSHTVVASR